MIRRGSQQMEAAEHHQAVKPGISANCAAAPTLPASDDAAGST